MCPLSGWFSRCPSSLLILFALALALPTHALRGGETAPEGKWPYHVGMFIRDVHACGGTLLTPRHVLTAAHCPQGIPKEILSVYIGSQELERKEGERHVLVKGPGMLVKVARIHVHPRYDHNRTHDIAILELASPAPESYGTATLPNSAIHDRIAANGAAAVAVGWGTRRPLQTSNSNTWPPTNLEQATLTLRSQSECSGMFQGEFNQEAHICTREPGSVVRSICESDSGGPLFVRRNGIDYQVGINSFVESIYTINYSCDRSGFTKVATYVDWINRIISPHPPPTPANLRAVASDGAASLTWDRATTERISHYEYRYRPSNGDYGSWIAMPDSGPITKSYQVAGLTNGTAYAFQLRAVNWDGPSEASAEATATPSAGLDIRPAFNNETVTGWTWMKNAAIVTRQLPEAEGGDGNLTYAITPALPAGISFDATTRQLSGKPTTTQTPTEYSYTATDSDGDKATLKLVLEVSTAMTDRTANLTLRTFLQEQLEDRGLSADWSKFSEALMEEANLTFLQMGEGRLTRGAYDLASTVQAQVLAGWRTIRTLVFTNENLATMLGTPVGYHNDLSRLRLHNNRLNAIPDGLFDYMDLTQAYLHDNPGSPFQLTISAKASDGTVWAHVAQGAPRKILVDYSCSTGCSGTAVIPAGKRDGVPFSASSSSAITMTLSNPRLDGVTESLSDSSGDWRGLNLAISSANASAVIPAGQGTDPPPSPSPPSAPPSQAPTANAGTDIRVTEGEQVTLTGSGMDPENGMLTYSWAQTTGPLVSLSDSTAQSPTFAAPTGLLLSPELGFALTVTDPTGVASEPDTVIVHVISIPRIAKLGFVGSPPVGDSYRRWDVVRGAVTFSQAVSVEGSPQLTLNVGGKARTAPWTGILNSRTLVFDYRVREDDRDTNGIGFSANALSLNGSRIRYLTASDGTEAEIGSQAMVDDADHKVDGRVAVPASLTSVAFASAPESGDTYRLGEPIVVGVRFSRPVTVTGSPQVALTIGMNTRQAVYVGGSGGRSIFFLYEVQASDSDSDGASIATDSITLNGGSIDSGASLAHAAVAADAMRKVDGSLSRSAAVILVLFANSPEDGETYQLGEAIDVEVWFDRSVTVTGSPYVELAIGTNTRQAAYIGGAGNRLTFRYELQADDVDADGIGINANLHLNGGTISDRVSALAATLTFDAIAASSTRKTDGSQVNTPRLRRVQFNVNTPPRRHAYAMNEGIWLEAWFDKAVTVTGAPEIALTIGEHTRQALYHSTVAENRVLFFHYAVQSDDADDDGVGIAANALSLNDGTIRLAADGITDATITHAAVAADPVRQVDGSVSPTITPPTTNPPTSNPPTTTPPVAPPVSPPPPPLPADNRAPEVIGAIENLLLLQDDTRAIAIAGLFLDPDGNPLTYSALSSSSKVSSASVEDGTLHVVGVASGKATITLMASDGDRRAHLSFVVTVKGPPRAVGEIAALSLPAGSRADTLLIRKFLDPDKDALVFGIASSQPEVAQAAMQDRVASIAAQAPGVATMTVTATDEDGLSASLSFRVTVAAPLPDREVMAGETLSMPLAALLTEKNSEAEPEISSSDDTRVTAEVADSVLTIAAGDEAEGAAAISLTTTAGNGWRKTLVLQVEVVQPRSFLRDWRLLWLWRSATQAGEPSSSDPRSPDKIIDEFSGG